MESNPKITLEATGKRLDYHDNVVDIDESEKERIEGQVWYHKDRFYVLSERCRGTYQSGKKGGQLCWKNAWGDDGLCSKHRKQADNFQGNQ